MYICHARNFKTNAINATQITRNVWNASKTGLGSGIWGCRIKQKETIYPWTRTHTHYHAQHMNNSYANKGTNNTPTLDMCGTCATQVNRLCNICESPAPPMISRIAHNFRLCISCFTLCGIHGLSLFALISAPMNLSWPVCLEHSNSQVNWLLMTLQWTHDATSLSLASVIC